MISGCSYTENSVWPRTLFPNCKIANLAKSGAGNKFISESIINSVNLDNPPDFVFILFSVVNRFETTVPNNELTREFARKYKWTGRVRDTLYFFSTGDRYTKPLSDSYNKIKDPSWPELSKLDDILLLDSEIKEECIDRKMLYFNSWDLKQLIHTSFMLQYLEDPMYHETLTYRSMLNVQNFLKLHNIPYMFSFLYEPWIETNIHKHIYGSLTRQSYLYDRIDWSKFINIHPSDMGNKHNLMEPDGLHLSPEGQILWANTVSEQVHKAIPNLNKALHD